MGATEERHTLEVCVDCLMLLANGDTPPEMGEHKTAGWLADIDRNWPATDGWHVMTACPEECDGGFSWQSCDHCGSPLGGERHPAMAWRRVAANEQAEVQA